MFGKKFSSNIRRRKRMITSSLILLVVFLTVGYSIFSTDLSINGILEVSKYNETLYSVLEKEAEDGTYAREYVGNHHDSFTVEPTKKIYYWYADTTTVGNQKATEILDKNNVIFANQCWQMIRTTDTGGVKMIYNGEPVSNQCYDSRANHQGFRRGDAYRYMLDHVHTLGTDFTFDKNNSIFTLAGDISEAEWTNETYQQLFGKWACHSSSCDLMFYVIDRMDDRYAYTYWYGVDAAIYNTIGNESYTVSDYFNNGLRPVGWKHNSKYMKGEYALSNIYKSTLSQQDVSSSNWFSYDVEYNSSTRKYRLISPFKVADDNELYELKNVYSLSESGQSSGSTSVTYISGYSGSTPYGFYLSSGKLLNDVDSTYIFSDNYTLNPDGTYTFESPTTFKLSNYIEYKDSINSKYICENAVDNKCERLLRVNEVSNKGFYSNDLSRYTFGKEVSYNNGTYKLIDSELTEFNVNEITNGKTAVDYYTCLNYTGECSKIYYVYYIFDKLIYYTLLENGDLYNKNLENKDDSRIKFATDFWFKKNLNSYKDYIEDTIYCNDREVKGTAVIPYSNKRVIVYQNERNSELSCSNDLDKFSMANSLAQLDYPVGLLTMQEVYLLNNPIIFSSNKINYYLMTPVSIEEVYYAGSYGSSTTGSVNAFNIRPTISLKPGTKYVSGSGSKADPYIVE